MIERPARERARRAGGWTTRRSDALPALALAVALAATAGCGPPRPYAPSQAYDRFCSRCHADDGTGDPKAVRLNPKLDLVRSEMVREAAGEEIRQRIVDGRGAMPGFASKLTPQEIDALVAYTLKRFGPPGGDASGPAAAPGGPDRR